LTLVVSSQFFDHAVWDELCSLRFVDFDLQALDPLDTADIYELVVERTGPPPPS
jgi:hypothetical protein